MEKEDELKAEHWVEPFRGMQLCAAAAGINNAIAVRKAIEASCAISFTLADPLRDLKINEGFQNAQWYSEKSFVASSTLTSTLLASRGQGEIISVLVREATLRAACYRKLILIPAPLRRCATILILYLT